MLAEEFFHSTTLKKTPIVEAVRPEDVGDAVGIKPVVGLQWHHRGTGSPPFRFRRRQTFSNPTNRDSLLELDANSRASQDTFDGVGHRWVRDIRLHAGVLQTCGDEDACELGRALDTVAKVIIGFAVESKWLFLDFTSIAEDRVLD